MKATSRVILAETFGMLAHEQDRPRIPALDGFLMEMLQGQKPGEGDALTLMQAWTGGWQTASNMREVA